MVLDYFNNQQLKEYGGVWSKVLEWTTFKNIQQMKHPEKCVFQKPGQFTAIVTLFLHSGVLSQVGRRCAAGYRIFVIFWSV